MNIVCILFCIGLSIDTFAAQTITCNDAFECANSTLSGQIFSRGYKSTAGSLTSLTITDQSYIDGSFGAYQIGSAQSTS